MTNTNELPLPVIDALPLGAHRLMSLTDEALFQACGVRIAYFRRDGGVSAGQFASLNCSFDVGDSPQAVERNLGRVCQALGVPNAVPHMLHQVHGADIVRVHAQVNGGVQSGQVREDADGLLVEERDAVALLISADCPLIVVVSPTGRFVVVHAGWRGTVAGIAGKAVRELARLDACDPSCYNAYIGPHIRSECFQVQADVKQRFLDEYGWQCVTDECHVSLAAAIMQDLMRNGMDASRIADSGICTKCNSQRYFSYRATEGKCGRHCAAVVRLR